MARYLPLFSVQVDHTFFQGGVVGRDFPIRIEATKACLAAMEKENLLIRQVSQGIEIWCEQHEYKQETEAFAFEFLMYSADPHVETYTAWDVVKPICFQTNDDDRTQIQRQLKAKTIAPQDFGLSSFERQRQPILCSVQLHHSLQAKPGQAIAQYKIQLQSKAMHWKYYFSGALAKKKLVIIDLDANTELGIRFSSSSNVVTENSLAFVSEAKLPMRSIPTQRFQLREEDATGRVLMRRLPNASIEKIGKEKGPDGQSLVVAEIYIHQ